MNKTLAIITSAIALTLNAQAVTIDITRHDMLHLVFTVSDVSTQGYTPLREEWQYGDLTWIAGISANSASDDVTYVALNWVTPWFQWEDSLHIGSLTDVVTGFSGDGYRLLGPGVHEFTYHAPAGIPDGGSALGLFGCALLGIWGGKRVLA